MCRPSGVTEGKIVNLLTAFIKLLAHVDYDYSKIAFSIEDILSWYIFYWVATIATVTIIVFLVFVLRWFMSQRKSGLPGCEPFAT